MDAQRRSVDSGREGTGMKVMKLEPTSEFVSLREAVDKRFEDVSMAFGSLAISAM